MIYDVIIIGAGPAGISGGLYTQRANKKTLIIYNEKSSLEKANKIAPTIVGGSKKHGGPDLGPVRARNAWAELGVDGRGIANSAPEADFEGNPRLTKEMIALIQGFPENWTVGNKKTAACRMIGNAFPPPVACAVGKEIRRCLENG